MKRRGTWMTGLPGRDKHASVVAVVVRQVNTAAVVEAAATADTRFGY